MSGCRVDSSGSGYDPGPTNSCEHVHEAPGSGKGGDFLYQLSDYQILKKNSLRGLNYM